MISLRMALCKESLEGLTLKILGIETSCDETGVAVYEPGAGVLAEALFSQVALHDRFGGIVPELSLIQICRCRRYSLCRSRWAPDH